MPEDRDSALSLINGSPPAPATIKQSREVDLQAGKQSAPGKAMQDIIAGMQKGRSPGAVEQRQRASEFVREWHQTHGQAQDKERAMER